MPCDVTIHIYKDRITCTGTACLQRENVVFVDPWSSNGRKWVGRSGILLRNQVLWYSPKRRHITAYAHQYLWLHKHFLLRVLTSNLLRGIGHRVYHFPCCLLEPRYVSLWGRRGYSWRPLQAMGVLRVQLFSALALPRGLESLHVQPGKLFSRYTHGA